MHMANIEVRIPENAKEYVMHDTSEEMRNALLLYPSIANNTISHGRAAELLGMHKMELIELYSRLGIPYIEMPDEEFEEEVEYTIVGSTEVDLANNKISNESPIGKALLGAKKNEVIEVEAPAGVIKYKVLSIKRA